MMKRALASALTCLALAPRPAGAVPAVPLGVMVPPASGAVLACPLYWRPGDPLGLFPHSPVRPEEPTGGLSDASGHAALRAARGWIEVGRPETALALLDSATADSPEARLYRLEALAALDQWDAFEAALPAEPGEAIPAGCAPLVDRWRARSSMARGEKAAADRAFDRLAKALPELGAYVDLWRLESAAEAGDVARGEAAWSRVEAAGLPRVALRDARAVLPLLYERGGRPDFARRWHLTLAAEARGSGRAVHWLAAARLAEAAGDRAAADALRHRVLDAEPSAASGIVLDPSLRSRLGIEALEAANVLLAANRPAAAEPFATAAVESAEGEARRQAALLVRAGARAAGGDRAGAESDYAAFLAQWPGDPRAPDVLYDHARLALTSRDGAQARRRLEDFLARFPAHPKASAALYLLADSHQDDRVGNPGFADRALALFDRLVRDHPGSNFADRAYLRAAHLAYALGRYAEAERRYAAYGSGKSAREARYWLARTAEKQGEETRAREIYRALGSADDYYGLQSRERLAGGSGLIGLAGGTSRLAPLPSTDQAGDAILATPAGRTAATLLALGERRYARAELERAVEQVGGDRERLAVWAPALAAWGFPDLTLQIGVRLGVDQGLGERFAYPRGFAEAVDAEARAHGLDPHLLWALIRQESLFRSDAVSPADARGLMQILPATGGEIAGATGWPNYDPAVLHHPAVGLHFGAHYLADQLARFDGFWPAVLAAYNGGPDNVAVWWNFPERTLDPELWIDRIPYQETREYVRKVLSQYAAYRRLYGAPVAAR